MRLFFLLYLAFACTAKLARAEDPFDPDTWHSFVQDQVVKVISHLKSGDATFEGSGLILRQKGKVYVVTADHAVLQSNDLALHEIYVRGNPTPNPCRILATRYRSGLTLLECEMKVPFSAGEFYSGSTTVLQGRSNADTVWMGDRVEHDPYYFKDHYETTLRSAGYPIGSFTLSLPRRGQSHLSYMPSQRLLVDVDVMLRLEFTDAERGMSGGIVYDDNREQGAALRGILSHRLDENGNAYIFVIPVEAVSDLLFSVLNYPKADHSERIRQSPRQQLRSPYDVSIDKYDFESFEAGTGQDRHYLLRVRRIGKIENVPDYLPRKDDFAAMQEYHFARRRDCAVYLAGERDQGKTSPVYNIPSLYDRMMKRFTYPVYSVICPETPAVIQGLPALAGEIDGFLEKAKGIDSGLLPTLKKFREDLRFFEQHPEAASAAYPTWILPSERGDLAGGARVYGTWQFKDLEPELLSLIDRSEAALAALTIY